MKKFILLIGCLFASAAVRAQAQTESTGFQFTDERILEITPVKDQASSGTCWSFSGIAQIESELLRLHPADTIILSDMWIVRHTYMDKAVKYLRLYGTSQIGQGGNTHDIYNVIREHGIVPEEVYRGLNYGTDRHLHAELEAAVKGYMAAVAKKSNGGQLSTAWQAGLDGILDAYLGPVPESFTYRGKTYTPQSFAASLGLNWDDYVSVTSFTHHPFYTAFAIEIPDNWLWAPSYNVPMEALEAVIDHSLAAGHTVTWAADVSEPGFLYRQGFAVLPATSLSQIGGSDMARWTGLTEEQLRGMSRSITGPVPERIVTQAERQSAFDNQQTTDDHGMQIVGTAHDQSGNKFYKVKNSWGESNLYDGYFYVSPAYINYKTICLMVHKSGIPAELRTKLGL
jgi:bleomycin hydrolase